MYFVTIELNRYRRSSTATAGGWRAVVLSSIYLFGFYSLLPLGLHCVGSEGYLLRDNIKQTVGVISPFEPAVSALVNIMTPLHAQPGPSDK